MPRKYYSSNGDCPKRLECSNVLCQNDNNRDIDFGEGAWCCKQDCKTLWCKNCVDIEFKDKRAKAIIMVSLQTKPQYLSYLGDQPNSTINSNAKFRKWQQRPSGAWYQGMMLDEIPHGKGIVINTEYKSIIIAYFKEGVPELDYTIFNWDGGVSEKCNR